MRIRHAHLRSNLKAAEADLFVTDALPEILRDGEWRNLAEIAVELSRAGVSRQPREIRLALDAMGDELEIRTTPAEGLQLINGIRHQVRQYRRRPESGKRPTESREAAEITI